jgi:hypothetical protein
VTVWVAGNRKYVSHLTEDSANGRLAEGVLALAQPREIATSRRAQGLATGLPQKW